MREMANNAMGWANARNPPIACKILDTHILRDVCRVCVRCSEMKLLPPHCAMFHHRLRYGHCMSWSVLLNGAHHALHHTATRLNGS